MSILKNMAKEKKISRKTWIRRLDRLVSKIVLSRDKSCVVCGSDKNLTAGHLFSRVAYSTRWDLDNVYCQCKSCNLRHEYDFYPLLRKVIDKFGIEFCDNLHARFKTRKIFKSSNLEELYNSLLERVK